MLIWMRWALTLLESIRSVTKIFKRGLTEQWVLDATWLELSCGRQHTGCLISRCSRVDRIIGLGAVVGRFIRDRLVHGRESLGLLARGNK